MENCCDLRDAVEQLIREGRLAKYIVFQRSLRKRRTFPLRDEEKQNPSSQRTSEPEKNQGEDENEEHVTKIINVIVGGFAGGGITKSA